MTTRFAVDENRVACEVLGGDVVVVDLDTGYCYLLDDTTAAGWTRPLDGVTPTQAAPALSARHPADGETIREAVGSFVEQLTEERLPAVSDRAAPPPGEGGTVPMPDPGSRFVPPVLNRYSNMRR